jgi:hypothetical protein
MPLQRRDGIAEELLVGGEGGHGIGRSMWECGMGFQPMRSVAVTRSFPICSIDSRRPKTRVRRAENGGHPARSLHPAAWAGSPCHNWNNGVHDGSAANSHPSIASCKLASSSERL